MAEFSQDERGLLAEQDKDSFLDYSLDWKDWLGGDRIVASEWLVSDGITLTAPTYSDTSTTVWVQGGSPKTWYILTNRITTAAGRRDERVIRLYIRADAVALAPARTALFPNIFDAIEYVRQDRLAMAWATVLPKVEISDETLSLKIRAAETDASRRLRVFFEPVTVFPKTPSADEISALNGGRWVEEAPYDYEPGLWSTEDWGYLVLRQKPVISVDSIVLAYPAPTSGFFTVPLDWVRVDKKAAHLRFVPTGSALSAGPLSAFLLSAMGGGRSIPQMIQVRYRAGLQDATNEYPDLVDLVLKMAVLRLIQDAYLPQSGSISADGLSQSISVKMDDYHDAIEDGIEALRESIHGVRVMVL